MFTLSDSDKFYLYSFPTDMRKSFYSLSGIVLNEMQQDIQQGDAFIFVNRSLTSMKILHMEFGGLVIYNLKLEQGRIQLPEMQATGLRYNRKALILASQLPVADWYNVFQSELIAEACLDRLMHKAIKFDLKGESLRKKY